MDPKQLSRSVECSVTKLNAEKERTEREIPEHPGGDAWQGAGPTNVGGRMTCIVADPDDPNRIWAGAASGGVWFSHNAGRSWESRWKEPQTPNVGTLVIAKHDGHRWLYCGTGEANLVFDSYPGVGLYRSHDEGKSWQHFASTADFDIPSRISTLVVDPSNPQHLLLGGIPNDPEVESRESLGGMYVSRNGGGSWRRETFYSRGSHSCHQILFRPGDPHVIYACFSGPGPQAAVWRSSDGGSKWRPLTKGLPHASKLSRTSLAISQSKPRILYLLAGDRDGNARGVFKSDNGGENWKLAARTSAPFRYRRGNSDYESGMFYNNVIAVHPEDPDHVLWGGVDLHLTRDGGQKWKLASKWDAEPARDDYVHADQHDLLFVSLPAGYRIYSINDGGLAVSEDGGDKWQTPRNPELPITMFYDLDVARQDPSYMGGGSQDTGVLATNTGKADDFSMLLSGDGGWLIHDPTDPKRRFFSSGNFTISKDDRGKYSDISPKIEEWEKDPSQVWMVILDSSAALPGSLYTGSFRIWRSPDRGGNWFAGEVLDGTVITSINAHDVEPDVIYAGTASGGLFRSDDRGKSFGSNLGLSLPRARITRIGTPTQDPDRVVVTLGGSGHSHVFTSADRGRTWQDVDRKRLPDVPHNSVALAANHLQRIYVGSDAGVFISLDFGVSWARLTGNLPPVRITDLVFHDSSEQLFAATYGRSLWKLRQT